MLVSHGRFGYQDVTVRYVPAPGFVGNDTVGITVGDGTSAGMEMVVNVNVTPKTAAPLPMPLPPGSGDPAPGQAEPVAPVDQARKALGTRAVRLLEQTGVARVYAATRAARAGRPALAVTCDLACRVEARLRGRRAGRQRRAVQPGSAGVIAAPRRVRARKRIVFALRIRTAGQRERRTAVRVRVRR